MKEKGFGFGLGGGADVSLPIVEAKADIPSVDVNVDTASVDADVSDEVEMTKANTDRAPGDGSAKTSFKERLEWNTPNLMALAAECDWSEEDSDDGEMEPLTHNKPTINVEEMEARQSRFSTVLADCSDDLRALIGGSSDDEAAIKLSVDAAADAEPAAEAGGNVSGGIRGGFSMGGSVGLSGGVDRDDNVGGVDLSTQDEGSGSLSNSASIGFKSPSLF